MKLRRFLTALLVLLFACGCEIQSPNQGKAASPGATSGGVAWGKYEDPLEQAFTVDVPKGWTVKGGMFRLGYSDHRSMVDMTSPDGRINVRVGDVAIPTYFLPNQFHHEGEVYDLGAQAQGRVARYRSGQEFAQAYGRVRFARVCQSLTPQPTSPSAGTQGGTQQGANGGNAGEVTYACGGSQGERTAYVFAQTHLTGGLWQVVNLASYIAPEGQVALARDITIRAINSIQLHPEWIQKQNQLDQEALVYQRQRQQARVRALSQQVAQFEQGMQAMRDQVASFERGQAQRQSQFQAMDNVISGITPTTDPYGNTVNVFNGPKSNYYRNPGTGEIRNADKSPGAGWDPLTPQQ